MGHIASTCKGWGFFVRIIMYWDAKIVKPLNDYHIYVEQDIAPETLLSGMTPIL